MAEWLSSMSAVQKAFAYIAIAGTFALILQVALLAVGLGAGHDADHDHDFAGPDHDHDFGADGSDHDFDTDDGLDAHGHGLEAHDLDGDHDHDVGLRVFTLRGIVAFFSVLGWSGLALLRLGLHPFVSVPLSFMLSLMAMLLMAMAMRTMLRLQVDGSLNLKLAVGREGEVYIPIPPNREGVGKVTLVVQERLVELSAVSDSLRAIQAGSRVFVADVLEEGILLVEPASDP